MRILALEYHDVFGAAGPDASGFPGSAAASYKVSEADFAAHLRTLSARGDVGVDVSAILRRSPDTPSANGALPVAMTFDDGGASAVHIADALEEFGWRGYFFVTTSRIGTGGFLSAAAVRQLHERGHFMGSHSHTHPTRMALCTDPEIGREWRESIERLSGIVSAPVTVASVPGGYYSARIAELASDAGIRLLFTSEPTMSATRVRECDVVGRYTIRRQTPVRVVASLVSARASARRQQWIVWNAKKVVKRIAGRPYLYVRSLLLGQ